MFQICAAALVLSCLHILPLSDNGGVGFKVKIGLALLYNSLREHIYDAVDEHGVDTRVLIFGAHRDESEVHNLGFFRKLQKLDDRREGESAAALFESVTDGWEA